MDKIPVLVILAAGMGSRYGGLKQIDSVGPNGELIIDYSIYDAKEAGFEKVVFIIKKEIEDDFKTIIGNRISKFMEVEYAYQELSNVPAHIILDIDRVKPLGTAHAIYCAREIIREPFVIINADDYYGKSAFKEIFDYLKSHNGQNEAVMVGYSLKNTVSKFGSVTRGLCQVEDGCLQNIIETSNIEVSGDHINSSDQNKVLDPETIVSMNMWGFQPSFNEYNARYFEKMIEGQLKLNPLKAESLLPTVVGEAIKDGALIVTVLHSKDKWFGVTYKEDKEHVQSELKALHDSRLYPNRLWT